MDLIPPSSVATLFIDYPYELDHDPVPKISVGQLVLFQPPTEEPLSVSRLHTGHNLNPRRPDQELQAWVRSSVRCHAVDGVVHNNGGTIQLDRRPPVQQPRAGDAQA